MYDQLTNLDEVARRMREGAAAELFWELDWAMQFGCGPEFPEEGERWTFMQVLQDWRNFLVEYRSALAAGVVDPAMLAWNHADCGPVHEAAKARLLTQPIVRRLYLEPRPPLELDTPELMSFNFTGPCRIRPTVSAEEFYVHGDGGVPAILNVRDGTKAWPAGRPDSSPFLTARSGSPKMCGCWRVGPEKCFMK